jgi:hypothetical protein
MNKEDIIMNAIFFGAIIASFALSFHMVNRGIEIDTTPLYWPETFPPDPEPDWEDSDEWHKIWYNKLDTNSNGEVDETEHYEYHGKEGKSEYGEYEYDKWMEMQ